MHVLWAILRGFWLIETIQLHLAQATTTTRTGQLTLWWIPKWISEPLVNQGDMFAKWDINRFKQVYHNMEIPFYPLGSILSTMYVWHESQYWCSPNREISVFTYDWVRIDELRHECMLHIEGNLTYISILSWTQRWSISCLLHSVWHQSITPKEAIFRWFVQISAKRMSTDTLTWNTTWEPLLITTFSSFSIWIFFGLLRDRVP